MKTTILKYLQKTPLFVSMAILVAFSTFRAEAKCGSGVGQIYPSGETLVRNPVILLNLAGYALSPVIAADLNLVLESETEEIPLKIIRQNDGGFSMRQLLLSPAESLQPGVAYTMKAPGNLEFEAQFLQFRSPETGEKTFKTWIASESFQRKTPVWQAAPKLTGTSYHSFGCGPALWADYSVAEADTQTAFVEVELVPKNMMVTQTHTFILPVTDDKVIHIGHGMCSGPFAISPDQVYQVRFTALSAGGLRQRLTSFTGEFSIQRE